MAGAERAARSTIRDSHGRWLQRMVRLCGLSFWWVDGIHARGFGLEWFGANKSR